MTLKYFSVRGSGNFPFHMLALSRSWPATGDEAEKIVMACPTQAREQIIVLATQHDITGEHCERWRTAKWPIQSIY